MKYDIIGSSSKGNCIVIEDILMLDCGVSYSKIKGYLKNVKLIFISHIHQDHLNKATIRQISFNYPTLKFLTGSKDVCKALDSLHILRKNIYILPFGKWYSLGIIMVKLEKMNHDVENYGLHWKYKNKKGIYLVDTSQISHIQAKDYDLYLIENNYREDILNEHIRQAQEENDENMLFYLNRVPYTHLSAEQANSFLIENMGENSEYCYIHQSDYNYKEE